MNDETFQITEENQRRLIIDLLVRVTTENTIMRQYLLIILGQDNPQAFQAMQEAFRAQYTKASKRLKETIYANYGHIDLDDLLPPDPTP